jgi:hypothetical protein
MLKKVEVLADDKKYLYAFPYLTSPSLRRYERPYFNTDI